ncbi:MAG: InlB B-repeat-containing protein [Acholeplasmataceae bacterium]
MKKLMKIFSLILVMLSLFLISGCFNEVSQLTDQQKEELQIISDFLSLDVITFNDSDSFDNVSNDVMLLTGYKSYQIHWESDNPSIINIVNGVGYVNRQSEDVLVTLQATIIVRDDLFSERQFDLIVKKIVSPTFYNVTLDLDGGILENNVFSVESGQTFIISETPVKEGFIFLGWTFNNEEYDFTKPVTEDITLVAVYEKIIVYQTITLNLNGGIFEEETPLSYQIIKGELFTDILNSPTKNGYTFDGWYLDGVLYEFETPVNYDVILEAKYTPINYQITYQLTEGETNHPDNVISYTVESDTIMLLAASKEGHTFVGWFDNNNKKVEMIPKGSFTNYNLTARFNTDQFSITVEGDGYNASLTSLIGVNYGTEVTFTFNKGGFILDKVVVDNNEVIVDNCQYILKVTDNHIIKITWEELFTVTLLGEGLSSEDLLTNLILGDKVLILVEVPVNQEIVQFKVDNEVKELTDANKYQLIVSGNHKISVIFQDIKVNVVLNPNGGSLPTGVPLTHQISMGSIFDAPTTIPVKDGYEFIGWYLNGKLYEFNLPINNDITLVAEYEEELDITYYSLTLPSGITADISNLNKVAAGTDVMLSVVPTLNKDTVVYVDNQYHQQDENGMIEIEVNSDVVVTKELIDQTISLFEARKMTGEYVNVKGIVTGIIPDSYNNQYIYVNDGSAAIILYSAKHGHLEIGDLIFLKDALISDHFNNTIINPKGTDRVLKKNQILPPAVYAADVASGTLDYVGLSLQAQRFDIENLVLLEKPTAGKDQNFMVEDAYGNEVQIRFHKYLTNTIGNLIWNKIKDVQIGDIISLSGAHLGQYQKSGEQNYIIQFMISHADEIIVLTPANRHKVTFILDNGQPNIEVNVVDGKTIPLGAVANPTKLGYTFIDWFFEGAVFDFNSPILDAISLTAHWEEVIEPENPTDPVDPGNNAVVIANQNDPKVISYYQGINFSSDASSLKSNLKVLITKSASSYDSAKSWLLDSDRDIANPNKLRGIYDQALFNRVWDGAATWNREHVWPQSKLGSAPKGEAHNLRVSGVRINSSRGNMMFSETSSSTGNLGYKIGNYWWPGDVDKGDVARILMFMNLRYNLSLSNSGESNMGQLKLLYKWHLEDPVDAFEIQRNNTIYDVQKNRNPFIDHPEIFAKLYQLIGGEVQASINNYEVFLQTQIDYTINMTNLNLTFLERKLMII